MCWEVGNWLGGRRFVLLWSSVETVVRMHRVDGSRVDSCRRDIRGCLMGSHC